ncbi:MAG: hypothetical protein JWN44_2628 [Myxococcales bacterium]|nr:hypothetical protein [Myxococcales bacterium]
MIRRLHDFQSTFADDDPVVFILAPEVSRPVPAGDTRRGTAWLFRRRDDAQRFADWVRLHHGLDTIPVGVRLRQLTRALVTRDLTWILDPEPKLGYGDPIAFKAPLEN